MTHKAHCQVYLFNPQEREERERNCVFVINGFFIFKLYFMPSLVGGHIEFSTNGTLQGVSPLLQLDQERRSFCWEFDSNAMIGGCGASDATDLLSPDRSRISNSFSSTDILEVPFSSSISVL